MKTKKQLKRDLIEGYLAVEKEQMKEFKEWDF